jgi:hypothetical protein
MQNNLERVRERYLMLSAIGIMIPTPADIVLIEFIENASSFLFDRGDGAERRPPGAELSSSR